MQITVTGQQIKIGESLQQYVTDNLEKSVKKYFDRALHARVVFVKQSHKHADLYKCDVLVDEGTGVGITIKSKGEGPDVYTAFDYALLRIDSQLRRYKGRIKNHRKAKMELDEKGDQTIAAKKYIISPHTVPEEDDVVENHSPVVIAEQATDIERLSVSEAVMKMDLLHLPTLLFINNANNRLNVVYHRLDGNIAWIDPEHNGAAKHS
jgi:ribosomal subunit interface protein